MTQSNRPASESSDTDLFQESEPGLGEGEASLLPTRPLDRWLPGRQQHGLSLPQQLNLSPQPRQRERESSETGSVTPRLETPQLVPPQLATPRLGTPQLTNPQLVPPQSAANQELIQQLLQQLLLQQQQGAMPVGQDGGGDSGSSSSSGSVPEQMQVPEHVQVHQVPERSVQSMFGLNPGVPNVAYSPMQGAGQGASNWQNVGPGTGQWPGWSKHRPNKPAEYTLQEVKANLHSIISYKRSIEEYAEEVQGDEAVLFYEFLEKALKAKIYNSYTAYKKSCKERSQRMDVGRLMTLLLQTTATDPGARALASFFKMEQGNSSSVHEYHGKLVELQMLVTLSSDPFVSPITEGLFINKLFNGAKPKIRARTRNYLKSLGHSSLPNSSVTLLHNMAEVEQQIQDEEDADNVMNSSGNSKLSRQERRLLAKLGAKIGSGDDNDNFINAITSSTDAKSVRKGFLSLSQQQRKKIQEFQRPFYTDLNKLEDLFNNQEKYPEIKKRATELGCAFPQLCYGTSSLNLTDCKMLAKRLASRLA